METLLEILAKDLAEWPDDVKAVYIAQDCEDLDGQVAWYSKKPVCTKTGEWSAGEGFHYGYLKYCHDMASDQTTAIITREQWEAARQLRSDY